MSNENSEGEDHIPACVGIIMDGNRRWAKEKGLPSALGHKQGSERVRDVLRWSTDLGIEHVIIYAFSTENWRRTEDEVGYLMKLIHTFFKKNIDELVESGMRVTFMGESKRFDDDIQTLLTEVEERTKNGMTIHLTVALSYGGRAEIMNAVQGLVDDSRSDADFVVSEESFSEKLWTAGVPDPDLIIRTGGAKRLSNFLPWQSVYSELLFTDIFWPAVTEEDYRGFIAEYGDRKRNFGK